MKRDLSKIIKFIFIIMLLIVFYNLVYLDMKTQNEKLSLQYNEVLNKELKIKKQNKIKLDNYHNEKSTIDNQKNIIEITKILNEETNNYKIYQNYLQGDNSVSLEIKMNIEFLTIIRITKKLEDNLGKKNIESICINNMFLQKKSKKKLKRTIEKDIFECIITINIE